MPPLPLPTDGSSCGLAVSAGYRSAALVRPPRLYESCRWQAASFTSELANGLRRGAEHDLTCDGDNTHHPHRRVRSPSTRPAWSVVGIAAACRHPSF